MPVLEDGGDGEVVWAAASGAGRVGAAAGEDEGDVRASLAD